MSLINNYRGNYVANLLPSVRIIHIIKRDQTNGNNDSNALAVLENLKNFQIQKL